jgi:hypothetical protein
VWDVAIWEGWLSTQGGEGKVESANLFKYGTSWGNAVRSII